MIIKYASLVERIAFLSGGALNVVDAATATTQAEQEQKNLEFIFALAGSSLGTFKGLQQKLKNNKLGDEVFDDIPAPIKRLASEPNRIYSARELIRRGAQPGPFHNFP